MNRRGFVAALAAVLVSGKGRSFAPRKPRGREPVDAATPTRPDDGLSRVTDRKMPPGYEFYFDPKVMRRWELRDDDYIYLANNP